MKLAAALAALLSLAAAAAAGPFDKGGISGVGARAFGMGAAVASQPGDASAAWWNPAGLDLLENYELSYQYGSLLGGRSGDNTALHRGRIPELGLAYGLAYRKLESLSSFKFSEQTTMLSAALPFTQDKSLSFGASLKLYQTELGIPGGEASGYGVDFGFLFRPPVPVLKGLTLGLSVVDFQSGLTWATGLRLGPPQLMLLGASYRLDRSTIIEVDAEVVTDHIQPARSTQGFKAGVERFFDLKAAGLEDFFAMRLGYLQSSSLQPTSLSGLFTLGAGIRWSGFKLDYAYIQDLSALGETHRLSAAWEFDPAAFGGGAAPKRTPTPARQATPTPTPSPTPAPTPLAAAGELKLQADSDVFAPLAQSRRPAAGFSVGYSGETQSYSLVITRQGSASPLRTLKGKKLPRSLRWDGKDQQGKTVPDGSYSATLRVLPQGGGPALSASTGVDVDTRRPELKVSAYPRIFDPNDPSRPVRAETRVEKLSGIPLRWEALIETLEGRRIKLFEGRGALPEAILWNGAGDTGEKAPPETIFYLSVSLEMESGAMAKAPRLALGSEVSAFSQKDALKVTLATVKFVPGDEVVALDDYAALKEAAEAVKKYGAEYLVQVLGYADDREAGGQSTGPLELSYLRAKAVRDFLVDAGLDAGRVKAMGFGNERPQGDNSDEGRAKNRKVDVVLYTK